MDESIESPFNKITDIYIPSKEPLQAFTYPNKTPVDESMIPGVMRLHQEAKDRIENDFMVNCEGFNFRGHRMPSTRGEMFIFRKMPHRVFRLKELGLHNYLSSFLVSKRLLAGGLIIVSGNPGNGKSTTLASIVVERLLRFAGMCIAIEDPIEMPIEGHHGNGYCIQRGVYGEEAFPNAVRDALRAYPAKTASMMMLGEVRDSETAALALRSSVDGRLVMLTMHAGSVIQSLKRFLAMAGRVMGHDEARDLLASSLRIAMNQRLINEQNGNPKLHITTLMDSVQVFGALSQPTIALEALRNDISLQQNLLKLGRPIELRNLEE